ncbi:PepSY domain-containing protein [Alteromonas gilva]|uniref:PepSY domain-containing protein n=1 Tax=Alteromonas gilva TaxID=2987522 RepID=A0ABT5L687_9ALTE|nr:PepSY domain-containing protein [Alteromonas gilva]MDC8832579.1 PepSY domain-containing protein [Alteromonas gilva]
MASPKFHNTLRQYHRWVGFFLAGIMAVYALSGVLLIFRKTDFLKFEQASYRQLESGLSGKALGEQLRIRGFEVEEDTDGVITFAQGRYNKQSGEAMVLNKDYPFPLNRMVKLHKATTSSPLFIMNIAFGVGLLFFVVSAFLMFLPRALPFKNGLKIAGVGFVFAVLVVLFGS